MHEVITPTETPTAPGGLRILRFPELRERKGISYSRMHVYRLEKGGDFPKRFDPGANSVGWLEHEVDAWIAAKAAARDRPPEPEPEPAQAA